MPETAVAEATKAPAVADPRAAACASLERAFARRDWPGFYAAAEALSRAAFDMGRKKGKYVPLDVQPEEPAAPPPAAEPAKEWSVGQIDASLVRFKREAVLFTVVRGDDPAAMSKMVCLCDNAENAALIQRALAAYKGS